MTATATTKKPTATTETDEAKTMNTITTTATIKPTVPVEPATPKKDVETSIDGEFLTLNFANGKSIVLDAAKLDASIRTYAMMDRLRAKLQDGAAIPRDKTTGKSAGVDDKYNAVLAIFERLTHPTEPSWDNKSRASAKITADDYLVMALAELKNLPEEKTRAFVESKTKEQRAALRKVPEIAAIIARLMSKGADDTGAELLGELDGIE